MSSKSQAMINSHFNFNCHQPNWLIFGIGKRIYHAWFQFEDKMNYLKYGACIFKNETTNDLEEYFGEFHLDTAMNRFERFPVITKIHNETIKNFLGSIHTRSQKIIFFESKKFKKFLLKCFVQFGVRKREKNNSYESLIQKQFDYEKCKIYKNIRTITNKSLNEIQKKVSVSFKMKKNFLKKHNLDGKKWELINPFEYNPNTKAFSIHEKMKVNYFTWFDNTRHFTILIQFDPERNIARYGACIYRFDTQADENENITVKMNYETAYQRFIRKPVFCKIPLRFHDHYNLRSVSSGVIPKTKANLKIIHRALCLFGVRDKNYCDTRSIGCLSIENKMSSDLKKWRRKLDKLEKKIGNHHEQLKNISFQKENKKILQKDKNIIPKIMSKSLILAEISDHSLKIRKKQAYSKRQRKLNEKFLTQKRVQKERRKAIKTYDKRI